MWRRLKHIELGIQLQVHHLVIFGRLRGRCYTGGAVAFLLVHARPICPKGVLLSGGSLLPCCSQPVSWPQLGSIDREAFLRRLAAGATPVLMKVGPALASDSCGCLGG